MGETLQKNSIFGVTSHFEAECETLSFIYVYIVLAYGLIREVRTLI